MDKLKDWIEKVGLLMHTAIGLLIMIAVVGVPVILGIKLLGFIWSVL